MAQGAFAQSVVPVRDIDVAHYWSYLPETHSVRRALHIFAEAEQVKRNGPLRIHVLPGTVPGTPADQIQAVCVGREGAPRVMLAAATGLANRHSPGFAGDDQNFGEYHKNISMV
jgi:TRAP-type C4-dicarboxylate transport system substrate-binding protein